MLLSSEYSHPSDLFLIRHRKDCVSSKFFICVYSHTSSSVRWYPSMAVNVNISRKKNVILTRYWYYTSWYSSCYYN